MNRDKRSYIRAWRSQIAADPRSSIMDDDAWYSSFVGLCMRLYFSHAISYEDLIREIG